MPYENPQAEYNATLDFIKQGFPVFDAKARRLAETHNIDTKDLPEAVETGERNLLIAYASLIAQRRERVVGKSAEKLAKKLGVDLDQLVEDIMINSTPM